MESFRFWRTMVGVLRKQWVQMQNLLANETLTDEPWLTCLEMGKIYDFLVKSFYFAMRFSRMVPYKFV
jgi:hypothetical protein